MKPVDHTYFLKKCFVDRPKTAVASDVATEDEAARDVAADFGVPTGPGRKRNRMRWLLTAVLFLVAAVPISRFAWHFFVYESTDDAYVAGRLHQISPQLEGRVKEVLVADNQLVQAGDVLVRLDPLEFEIGLRKAQTGVLQAKSQDAQAEAALRQAEAQLAEAQAHLEQAEAQLRQNDAQLQLARLNYTRDEHLAQQGGGDISKAELDAARGAFDSSQAADDAAKANLNVAKAGIASAEAARASAVAQQAAAHAAVAAGDAQVREAERKLSLTVLLAPATGRIGNKNVEIGNCVQVGQTLCALVEPDFWIVANFKETQLAKMRCGQPVDISLDALPGETLHGTVESMAPASGAQFALLPADNATGNFTKVVQRVPVKIAFDARAICKLADYLRPGLSTIVNVRVTDRNFVTGICSCARRLLTAARVN